MPAGGPGLRRQAARDDRGGDPVLVAHPQPVVVPDRDAEGLLVGEHEPARGLHQPLEAGQRAVRGDAVVGGGDPAPAASRRRSWWPPSARRWSGRARARRAGSRCGPRAAPPRCRRPRGRGQGEAVGVGVVGHDQVRAASRRPAPAPGPARRAPPGWGRRPSGSRGRAPTAPPPSTAARSRPGCSAAASTSAADAVQRGRRDPQRPGGRRARATRARRGDRVEVGLEHVVAEHLAGRAERHVATGTGPRRSARRSPASAGGHDLGAVAEVDLVAVVLRRVVAGGHHHPGRRAEVAHREGEHRRRQRPGQQQRPRGPWAVTTRAVSAAKAAEPCRAS